MTDIIVVGGGVAGMTAALNALRNGKSVLLLEQETIGGQIATSPKVENLPSITQISGSDFTDKLFEQITNLGASFELETVEKIEKNGDVFAVKTDYQTHECKVVVLANGVKHRHIGIDREEELLGKGVYYCAICDGAFYKDQEVALIGDANSALQYAIMLAGICKKVKLYTLFDKFFGDDILVKAVKSKDNIEITMGVSLVEFLGEEKLTGLKFKQTYGEETFTVDVPAVFIAIGQVPNNKSFENLVELDKNGYYVSDESCTTKTPGVFVAGDCRAKKMRQVTTAVADGAICGISASLYIDSLNVK